MLEVVLRVCVYMCALCSYIDNEFVFGYLVNIRLSLWLPDFLSANVSDLWCPNRLNMISYRLIKRVSQLTVVVIIRHKFGSCLDVPCPSAVTASVGCAHYLVVALPWPPENNHPLGLTHSKLMTTSQSAHRYRHVTYAQLYRTPLRVAAGGVCGTFVYCR